MRLFAAIYLKILNVSSKQMGNMQKKIVVYNTLGRKYEELKPIHKGKIHMYTCGPTVYGRAHIGNLRTYINSDIIKKTLLLAGYEVVHVMNITDVGHLTSDADTGDDKLQIAAKNERLDAWAVAKKYTELFFGDIERLGILKPGIICEATKHIPQQIKMVEALESKGYTYKTTDGIYFDTSKFDAYGELAKLDIKGLQAGKRIDLGEKKNKTDFALWKFSKPEEKRDMEWDSPWGKGFPGWHIECSAMSTTYLGNTFDIHTGGIDHIPIHHTNEIAQSECATGHKFVNYWLHSEFLVISEKEKMSKSLGNVLTLDTLKEKGYEHRAFRLLCLGAHYRKRLLFDEEIMQTANNSYTNLKNKIIAIKELAKNKITNSLAEKYYSEFKESLFNDFNTPQSLAAMWDLIGDDSITPETKYATLLKMDEVLGLDIAGMQLETVVLPPEIKDLLEQRIKHKANKEWAKADEIRDEVKKLGYDVLDTKEGYTVRKANN